MYDFLFDKQPDTTFLGDEILHIPGEPVTDRDQYIVANALTSALPFLLLHSNEWSNLDDLMAIVASGKCKVVRSDIDGVVRCLELLETQGGPAPQAVEKFLDNAHLYLPRHVIERWKKTDLYSRMVAAHDAKKEKKRGEYRDIHDIFLTLYDSKMAYEKKERILESIISSVEWGWGVSGISQKAIEAFKKVGCEELPKELMLKTVSPFFKLANKLLRGEKLIYREWLFAIELGYETHLITEDEDRLGENYEFEMLDPSMQLFMNRVNVITFDDDEHDYLKRTKVIKRY